MNEHDDQDNAELIRAVCDRDFFTIEGFVHHNRQADLNVQNKDSNAALLQASRIGNEGIVDILLKSNNIDINLKNDEGNTALS